MDIADYITWNPEHYAAHPNRAASFYSYYPVSSPRPSESPLLAALAEERMQTATPSDAFGDIFRAKSAFLGGTVRELFSLLYERRSLKDTNLTNIDYEERRVKEALSAINWAYRGKSPSIDKVRSGLEKELSALGKERRFEEVACWRDEIRLRGDLREALFEFDNERRRRNLFDDL